MQNLIPRYPEWSAALDVGLQFIETTVQFLTLCQGQRNVEWRHDESMVEATGSIQS